MQMAGAQFGSLAHTLRNTDLMFTRPSIQKQPNQPVVRNTPTDPSLQCGDELMRLNLALAVKPDRPQNRSASHSSMSLLQRTSH